MVVTNINQLDKKWIDYAVRRTGVNLPNCFTYACARISQQIGKEQSLDGATRVVGAGQLWDNHAQEFDRSVNAQVGALAIFQGRYYGHIAFVEVVGHRMMISESNLGDYGAGYFRCLEMDKYVGAKHPMDSQMTLVGFLIHKDLKPKPTPQKPKQIGYQAHVENDGWQQPVYDGATAGTTGQSKRLEAIKMFTVDGTVVHRVEVHIQNFGWKEYSYPGADTIMGTTGKSLRMEAIKIKTSKPCKMRAHLQDTGWTKWVDCDGEQMVGTVGESRRLEALEIKRV